MQLKKLFKKTTHIFHPIFDDEFYINEIIGIEKITYEDWSEDFYINQKEIKKGKNGKKK